MKKPIDPNLDNLIDDLIESNSIKSESELTISDDVERRSESYKKEFEFKENEQKARSHHHHSSSSHHQSSSSHHQSSSSHHSSGSHHHSSSKKKKKKLSTAAKIAIAFLMIILILIFGVVFAFVYLESKGKSDFNDTSDNTQYNETIEYKGETYEYNDDVVAIAFIGVDKRELGAEEGSFGTAGQADADIVLTVNTKTGKAKVIAIPRDTMVDVDVYSENGIFLNSTKMQLCLSYAYGDGRAESARNVTTSISRILYDVPINKYFALDLNGIKPINDAIGGVTVQSLENFEQQGIKKGDTITLTGDLTEMYVRHRDINSTESSISRSERQMQYIRAFVSQLAPAVVKDFGVVTRLYNTASDYSSTNISLSNATYLATLLLTNANPQFESESLKGEMKLGTNTNPDVVYAEFYPDEEALMELVLDTFYTKK